MQYGELKGFYKVTKFFYPGEFVEQDSSKFDYALMKLEKGVVEAKEFLPLCLNHRDLKFDKNTVLLIFGYPKDGMRYEGKTQTKLSAFQQGAIEADMIVEIKVETSTLYHKLPTNEGQSGTPIISYDEEKLLILGIHKGSVSKKHEGVRQQFNLGRLFTP
jgi:V8-like Glu-specific endopeptidase